MLSSNIASENAVLKSDPVHNTSMCFAAWAGIPAVLFCLVSIVCPGCGPVPASSSETSASSSGSAAVRVTPIKPERKRLIRTTEQPGQIEAFEETPIYSKVAGFVRRVHVDIGDSVVGPQSEESSDTVKAGQMLAELDVPELEQELQQKRALVEQAAAEVVQANAAVTVAQAAKSSADAAVTEAEAAVERVDALYAKSKSEFERVTQLAENKAVPEKLREESEQQLRAADAARREMSARIQSAQAKVVEASAQVQKADADVVAAKAKERVAYAEEARLEALVSYTRLRAPFDGIVTTRNVVKGHFVQASGTAGHPLFVVVHADIVRIFIDVPEADAGFVQAGNPAKIRVPALGSGAFDGQITRTSWTLHPTSRTLRAEIDIQNTDGRLRPGMYAYVELQLADRPDVLSVPKSAVLTKDGQSFCLCCVDGKIVQTKVQTGIRTATDVEIVSGLTGNEAIIASNVGAYKDGQAVEIAASK